LMKSTIIGSTVSVLLAFSAISYSRTFVQAQDPKPSSQPNQPVQANMAENVPATEKNRPEPESSTIVLSKASSPAPVKAGSPAAHTYTATAYSLRGRTAIGTPVGRGVIAADPSVLPLGSHVWVDAGSMSGEYVVADTGGAVKGRRIDIWTPTSHEAQRFGRRAVKLTVLTLGGKNAKRATGAPRTNSTSTTTKPAKS
jgi:3D (Asp-Asp-Asp) domain-containing protein